MSHYPDPRGGSGGGRAPPPSDPRYSHPAPPANTHQYAQPRDPAYEQRPVSSGYRTDGYSQYHDPVPTGHYSQPQYEEERRRPAHSSHYAQPVASTQSRPPTTSHYQEPRTTQYERDPRDRREYQEPRTAQYEGDPRDRGEYQDPRTTQYERDPRDSRDRGEYQVPAPRKNREDPGENYLRSISPPPKTFPSAFAQPVQPVRPEPVYAGEGGKKRGVFGRQDDREPKREERRDETDRSFGEPRGTGGFHAKDERDERGYRRQREAPSYTMSESTIVPQSRAENAHNLTAEDEEQQRYRLSLLDRNSDGTDRGGRRQYSSDEDVTTEMAPVPPPTHRSHPPPVHPSSQPPSSHPPPPRRSSSPDYWGMAYSAERGTEKWLRIMILSVVNAYATVTDKNEKKNKIVTIDHLSKLLRSYDSGKYIDRGAQPDDRITILGYNRDVTWLNFLREMRNDGLIRMHKVLIINKPEFAIYAPHDNVISIFASEEPFMQ